jgi:hypothetical protein
VLDLRDDQALKPMFLANCSIDLIRTAVEGARPEQCSGDHNPGATPDSI